jgi:LPS-assembly protein
LHRLPPFFHATAAATTLFLALPQPAAAQATCAPGDRDCLIEQRQYALCRVNRLLDFYVPGLGDPATRDGSEISVDGREFDVSDRSRIGIQGNVELRRADQLMRTEHIEYDSETGAYAVDSPMTYQDAGLLVSAGRGKGNLQDGTVDLADVRYQFLASRGNGRAGRVEILDPERSRLEQMSFSTCDLDDPDWELRARRIDIDQSTGVGKARGATLYFRGIPLLYTPYGEFPIDERRKSGLLLPTVGSSNSGGLDFTLPYYLNLAPNYDMTLLPRIVGSRGYMLGAEFRYLLPGNHRGQVFGTWLPDDKKYNDSRGYFELRHHSQLSERWWIDADIRQVSDDRYFEDFGDSLSIAATSLLPSRAGVYGRGSWWNAGLSVDAYKIVDPTVPGEFEPYRRLPRATFEASDDIGLGFVAGVDSELVHFSKNEGSNRGTRLDVYPYLALPIERSAWFLRPELGWRQTEYDFDFEQTSGDASRGLPIFSVDSGLVFERETNWLGRDWLQTLEPRLFYLYVPYEDQSDIPVFDTQELTFGFGQLFRTNRFVGADRQGDANQATFAVSSRLIDAADGRERITASVGQIRYFRPQQVQLPDRPETDFTGSAYVGELSLRLSDDWYASVGGQWNPETDQSDVSSLRLQKRLPGDGVVNFTYRYRRNTTNDDTFLEQLDAAVLYPLSERWRLIGRWNWSILDSTTLEAMGGFEFESCCYAIRLLGRHYVRNTEGDRNNALYLEIELKGLGSLGRKSEDLLRRAILGYSRYGE